MNRSEQIVKQITQPCVPVTTPFRCCFWCTHARVPTVSWAHGRDLQCDKAKKVRDALELWQCQHYQDMPLETRDRRIRNRQKVLHDRIVTEFALLNQALLDEPERHAAIEAEGLDSYMRRREGKE